MAKKLTIGSNEVIVPEKSDISTQIQGSIVDNLTTNDATKPLSANQGKVLKDLVDTKANDSVVVKLSGNQTITGTKNFTGTLQFGGKTVATLDDITSVFKYKGSVASYANLPTTGQVLGDVWNVLDTGKNFAWDGTAWDDLSGIVDLSNYYTKSETDSLLNAKVTANTAITAGTATKITYDTKGLVTAGADATLDDIADGATRKLDNYVAKTGNESVDGIKTFLTDVYIDGSPTNSYQNGGLFLSKYNGNYSGRIGNAWGDLLIQSLQGNFNMRAQGKVPLRLYGNAVTNTVPFNFNAESIDKMWIGFNADFNDVTYRRRTTAGNHSVVIEKDGGELSFSVDEPAASTFTPSKQLKINKSGRVDFSSEDVYVNNKQIINNTQVPASTTTAGQLLRSTTTAGTGEWFTPYASDISYNNATSGLTATTVHDAIDELQDGKLDKVTSVSSFWRLYAITPDLTNESLQVAGNPVLNGAVMQRLDNGLFLVKSGSKASRPTSDLSNGVQYFNTDTKQMEVYIGDANHWLNQVYKNGDTLPTPASGTSHTYLVVGNGVADDDGNRIIYLNGTTEIYDSGDETMDGSIITISNVGGVIYAHNMAGALISSIASLVVSNVNNTLALKRVG